MKRTPILVIMILCSLLSAGVPLHAEDAAQTELSDQQTRQKNECLLVARNCGRSITSLQDKIELLKDEIAKGRAVYTVEELNDLKKKLDDVSKTLDFLLEK